MQFAVIYSVDVPSDGQVLDYAPPQVEDLWQQTEDDRCYEYSYLDGCWEEGHHRKWFAMLDRQQFNEFVDRCGLVAEDVQTMGSLGIGPGIQPAIAFNGDDPDAIQSAYVTPLPETRKTDWNEHDWDRVRAAVIGHFGRDRGGERSGIVPRSA